MIDWKANPALLFTPGSKPDLFPKAEEVGANGIILDLEDGVAEKDKDIARRNVIEYLSTHSSKKILKLVRINNLHSIGAADLSAMAEAKVHCDALIYPKAESVQEVNSVSDILNEKITPIFAYIETAKGLSAIEDIVNHCANLTALLFGAADYAADVGCAIDQNAFLYVRMKIVQAAALRKLATYDSPYFDFNDADGLVNEIKHAKTIGFTGKFAIHPKQIALIKSTFKPSLQEYQQAQAIMTTYETVRGEACQYQGKMIDLPMYQKAKQIVSIYNNLNKS
jgi:(S)-citramalyl-CoA lyase